MAEMMLTQRTPLLGLATPGRHGSTTPSAGVTVREVNQAQVAMIIARRERAGDVAAALSEFVGASVVDRPVRTRHGDVAVVGIAPGQWRMTRRAASNADVIDGLEARLGGMASVVDQSHGCVIIECSGPRARDALSKGIPVDLDPLAFKPGDAAQTVAGHITVQIALLDLMPTFELVTAASTAGSFWSWLSASAAEFGLDVLPPQQDPQANA